MVNHAKNKEQLIEQIKELQFENSLLKTLTENVPTDLSHGIELMRTNIISFEAVFESSPVAMMIIDETTTVVMVNYAAVKLCGGSEEDMLQHRPGNALRCVHSNKDPLGCGYAEDCKICKVRNGVESLIANGGTINGAQLEMQLSRNGKPEKVWMIVGVEPLMREGQKHWCIAMNDITEQKLIEESLRISEDRFRGIFNNLQDAFFQADLSGIFVLVSPSAVHMYEYESSEEMIGIPATCLYANPEDRERLKSELLDHGSVSDFICQGKRKNGSIFWVSMNVQFIYEGGKLSGTEGIVRDISERRLSEEKILESETRFREVLENSIDASYKRDLVTNTYDYLSPVFFQIAGYTQEELNKLPISEVTKMMHPDDLPELNRVISEALSGQAGNNFHVEYRFKHKYNGTYLWLNDNFTVMRDEQGKAVALIGSVSDNSKKKLAEDALTESEARFKTIFIQSPIGIAISDSLKGEFLQVNSRFAEITGWTIDEIQGTCWTQITHPDDIMLDQEKMDLMLSGKIPGFQIEKRYLRPDRSVVWINMTIVPLKTDLIDHPQNLCMIEDITEKKKYELELIQSIEKVEQSEYRLKLATASGQLGIWDWNLVENSMIWDVRMFDLYGLTRNTFPNNIDSWTNGLHPEDKQRTLNEYNAALNGEKEFDTSFRIIKPDGTVLYLKATGSVIRDVEEKPIRMIGINRDITEANLAEEQLRLAKEKAEESDRLKSAFLANMSHEIRTPLNSIIGFSELLTDPDFEQEQKAEFTKMIIENGNNLLVIINDIMDLSMLDSRQLKIRKEQFPVKKLLSDLENEYRTRAGNKGIGFSICMPENVEDIRIENDFYRIKQIFNNLIGNALKFTKHGFIEIGCLLDETKITFHVKDTGIGIAPEFHKAIFKRFRQVDETETRKYGGNGLGLSISKNLVKILGGEIWVESDTGKGSTFLFSLPNN